jgi:hypothetical protein
VSPSCLRTRMLPASNELEIVKVMRCYSGDVEVAAADSAAVRLRQTGRVPLLLALRRLVG